MTRRGAVLAAVGVVLLLLSAGATGLVTVAPGEAAVVRRLGRLRPRPLGPGLHLIAPWGTDRVVLVRTDLVRRLRVGLSAAPGAGDEPGAGEFLTGDLNLLRAEATVQYRVDDPAAFAVRVEEVGPLLARLAEAGLGRALARQSIDDVLRDGRSQAARDAAAALTAGASRYGLGVEVLGVSLTDARPPGEVAADFAAAVAARSDRDRLETEAKTYAQRTTIEAAATAAARTEHARALAGRDVTLARARAARFESLRLEADRARPLAVWRIYVDALRGLWPRAGRKLILTPEEPVDLSIVGDGR